MSDDHPGMVNDLVGTTLAGRYLVRRTIATSQRTSVLEAQHVVTKREVAVKLLRPEAVGDEACGKRLHAEARLLTEVRHPCVVDVLDAGMARHASGALLPMVVMELLDGRSLEGLMAARGALDLQDVLPIGLCMCRALDAVHRRDVVHGDVTPANIYLPPLPPHQLSWNAGEAAAKLLGFGAAAGGGERATTTAGAAYRAPEQIAGAPPSARGDIYALAAVLYQCLVDELPRAGTTTPPSEHRSDVPRHMSDAIVAALSIDPDERPEDAHDLANSLWRMQDTAPPPSSLRPASDGPERRTALRAPYVTPVGLERGKQTLRGRCEDISLGGMLVLTQSPMAEGGDIDVRFALPGRARFVVERGAIRWHKRGRQNLIVSGVEFVALTDATREAIIDYVTHFGKAPMHRWAKSD